MKDWQKRRRQAHKHARLMERQPELRQALYGGQTLESMRAEYGPPTPAERRLARDIIDAATRETALWKE